MKITVELTEEEFREFAEFCNWRKKERDASKKTPLRNLPMTMRLYNSLVGEGFSYAEDVFALSDERLLLLPNIGRKAVTEIREIEAEIKAAHAESPAQPAPQDIPEKP